MNAYEIVQEAVKARIPVTLSFGKLSYGGDNDEEGFYFQVEGFSKSGYVRVYDKDGIVLVSQRYDNVDEIEDFDGLVQIAWRWFDNYRNREPFDHPGYFKEEFINRGFLKVEMKEIYI